MKKKYLGVIPARGGSKGIPKKNIKELNGKPLIAYTIEAAQGAVEAGAMDRFIVSTDSEEIAEISRRYGAEVPFMRPDYLGGDKIKSVDVILHALSFMEDLGESYDAVLTLQPTSPMRTADDLIEGISMFDESDADSLIAVYEDIRANGFNYYRMGENNVGLAEHKEHNTGIRRQEMKPMYVRNGALYISTIGLLRERKLIIGDEPLLYVMPKERSTDVDSATDFEYIEFLMRKQG
ncbi:MAG: acylneuraminate cytidylyltransferase family protein [Clostridiales bacterium]|nr:acylneuraminate cytidylyltransferase family protein [Clostridiales bacterium]